ncbi:HAD family hydrolase [Nonomuraea typhae]|uniref:HAD family hydrolase n=1 Tax=Nonomuraea typhae TaxID=2603600 RepID=UPI0012F95150|nr:HAD family phosphatase [Nonomuraea typhae]
MTDVIVFDLYGVIAHPHSEQAESDIAALAGVPKEAFWEAYWACRPEYDLGLDGGAYWDNVARRLGTRFPDLATLTETDVGALSHSDPEMVALVEDLAREGRTLGILSNIVEDVVPVWEKQEWMKHFSVRTYSCRIGVIKPDPRAYEAVARDLGVEVGQILFFDDREENVLAARSAGMVAEVFTSAAQVREVVGTMPPTW